MLTKLSQWISRKTGMFGNYFMSAIRQMDHNKFASGINILSLAVGLAVALFVMLLVQHELSYDDWVPNGKQIYRYETEIMQRAGSSINLFTGWNFKPKINDEEWKKLMNMEQMAAVEEQGRVCGGNGTFGLR